MLLLQRLSARDPAYLVRLEEPQAVVCPRLLSLSELHTFGKRQVRPSYGFEPAHVQLSYLAAGDAEDLAQDPVGHVRGVARRGHEPPVLELDGVLVKSLELVRVDVHRHTIRNQTLPRTDLSYRVLIRKSKAGALY